MDSETNLIFEQYKQVNENIGLGPNGMSTVTITVGSNTNHPPRRQPGGTTFSAFSDEEHTDVKKEEEAVYIQAGDASDDDCGCSDCNGDHDGEIDMARAELLKAAEYATKLFNHLQDVDNLEGWTASKITKASDYLSSVYHALEYDALDANVEDEEVDDELEIDDYDAAKTAKDTGFAGA